MADDRRCRIALLSVHPEFAEAILGGTKTVEFRKRRLASDVTHVAIYATRPVGRVVGVFAVGEQVWAPPSRLWRMFRETAGISRSRFLAYYGGHERGVGIKVTGPVSLIERQTLQDAFGISRPPQSFQYFEATDTSRVLQSAIA